MTSMRPKTKEERTNYHENNKRRLKEFMGGSDIKVPAKKKLEDKLVKLRAEKRSEKLKKTNYQKFVQQQIDKRAVKLEEEKNVNVDNNINTEHETAISILEDVINYQDCTLDEQFIATMQDRIYRSQFTLDVFAFSKALMMVDNEVLQYIGLLATSMYVSTLSLIDDDNTIIMIKKALWDIKIFDNIKNILRTKEEDHFMLEISIILTVVSYHDFQKDADKDIIDPELLTLVCENI